MPSLITYRTIDLDLEASFDFQPLCEALERAGLSWLDRPPEPERKKWWATFETCDEIEPGDHVPERTAALLLDAIESLSEEHREQWNRCAKREFNAGFDCGDEPWAFQRELSATTIQRMATANLSFAVTIYPDRGQNDLEDAAEEHSL